MKTGAPQDLNSARTPGELIFAGLAGLILAAGLLKFGNPVIFANLEWNSQMFPESAGDRSWVTWLLSSWKLGWAYAAIVLLALSLFWAKPSWRLATSTWLVALPAFWFLWQLASSELNGNSRLSGPVVRHFFFCTLWFYLGVFGFGAIKRHGLCLGMITIAFGLVMAAGWQQRWGGLEETRNFFYQLPNWRDFPPAFLDKLSSNRIYATLFYPNALAGLILLVLPMALAWIWYWTRRWEFNARVFLLGLVGLGSLACLYWSQSKAGWLIFLVMLGVVFWHWPLARRWKAIVVGLVLVIGLGGFFLRYSGYFSRGATSVSARFEYWRAAVQGVRERPLFGTGPGTFSEHYARVKSPQAEMARLAHNDYLQQACDSGVLGFLAYAVFVWGSLIWLYRQRRVRSSLLGSAVWLGLFALSLQSFVEFGLYISAIAWLYFFFFGWLLSKGRSDTLLAHESPVPQRA